MALRSPRHASLHDRVEHNLTTHPPTSDEQIEAFEELRQLAKDLSHAVVELVPEGREQSMALTHIEDAAMQAIAGVARAEVVSDGDGS